MWPLIAAMAGMGLLKGMTDKNKAEAGNDVQVAKARYQNFTGDKPGDLQFVNPWGSALQGGLGGAMFGQSMESAKSAQNLADAQAYRLNSGGSGWGGGPVNTQALDPASIPYGSSAWSQGQSPWGRQQGYY